MLRATARANNVWRVNPDGRQHEIEIDHNTMTGKATVRLDGESRMLGRKRTMSFDIGGHPATVTLQFKYGGFAAQSSLHVDDRFVEPLRS